MNNLSDQNVFVGEMDTKCGGGGGYDRIFDHKVRV